MIQLLDENDKAQIEQKIKTVSDETNSLKGDLVEKVSNDEVKIVTNAMQYNSPVNILPATLEQGYISSTGVEFDSESFQHTNFIKVNTGDVLYSYRKSGKTLKAFPIRFIAAYDSKKSILPDKGLNNTTDALSFTVGENVEYLIITVVASTMGNGNGMITVNVEPTVWHDNFIPYYSASDKFIGKALSDNVKDNIGIKCFSEKGDMVSGTVISLPDTNVNKNKVIAFSCDITSFSELQIGRYTSVNTGYIVRITPTDFIMWRDGDETTLQHGLTIENNLQVRIVPTADKSVAKNTYVNIIITSNGKSYESGSTYFVREYGSIIAKSVGSILNNCVFSYIPMDIDKKIWMFGDSYFSWIPERWVYYLGIDGNADNCLCNGYSGETSVDAVSALKHLLTIGRPKYIVWCLGMNDGSEISSYSEIWKNGIDELLKACSDYSIIPILATIPTVPNVNNEYKNEWIRNSGYRFIDFAKAVGATTNGVWYGDMLGDDKVHPTVDGAKSLYGRAIADFPEFGMKN